MTVTNNFTLTQALETSKRYDRLGFTVRIVHSPRTIMGPYFLECKYESSPKIEYCCTDDRGVEHRFPTPKKRKEFVETYLGKVVFFWED